MPSVFSNRLKDLRKINRISGQKLADILECSNANVCQWEAGRNYPNTETMIRLADYFHVSIDYLLGRTDDPRPVSVHSMSDGEIIYIGGLDKAHKDMVKEIVKSFSKGE